MCFRPPDTGMERVCAKCGTKLTPVHKECPNCGEPVPDTSSAAKPSAPTAPGAPGAPKAPGAPN